MADSSKSKWVDKISRGVHRTMDGIDVDDDDDNDADDVIRTIQNIQYAG